MSSDAFKIIYDSSADIPGEQADPLMILARTMIVPKNSGIQNILPEVIKGINRARMLRPPYRQYAIQKAKEPLYGIAGISSEGGRGLQEINTHRTTQTMNVNQGQKVGPWDPLLYDKEYLKNNPKNKNDDFMF